MGFDRGSWPPSPGNRILQRLHHTCCTAKTSPGGLLSQALGTGFVLRQRAPMGSPQTLQRPQYLSQALGQLLGTEGRRYLSSWRLLQWEKGVTNCPVLRLGLALIAYQCHRMPLRGGDGLSVGHNSQQSDCAGKVSEFRFKSVKSFCPRSCQWWHAELVAEHLPEALLSSKVRSMTALGLHQPLAQPLRLAVGTH